MTKFLLLCKDEGSLVNILNGGVERSSKRSSYFLHLDHLVGKGENIVNTSGGAKETMLVRCG